RLWVLSNNFKGGSRIYRQLRYEVDKQEIVLNSPTSRHDKRNALSSGVNAPLEQRWDYHPNGDPRICASWISPRLSGRYTELELSGQNCLDKNFAICPTIFAK
ncbi:unnamed protein product, partial [Ectocarpus sp. 13 AM-2016]